MSPILADLTANLSLSDRQLRGDLAIAERGHLLKNGYQPESPCSNVTIDSFHLYYFKSNTDWVDFPKPLSQ